MPLITIYLTQFLWLVYGFGFGFVLGSWESCYEGRREEGVS